MFSCLRRVSASWQICLGKDSKQGSKRDQRQQRPFFQLLLWGRVHDQLRFFEAAPPPSGDEGTAGVVPGNGFQMPATSASFGVRSEGEAELPEEPCSKYLQPPSRKAFSLATRYGVTFKSFSRESPPLSRTPETLHFKLDCYKQRPLGLTNGFIGTSWVPRTNYPSRLQFLTQRRI